MDPPSVQAVSNLPIPTDQFGNARVGLLTATTATVEARSGTAIKTLTFNTVQGNLSSIILNIDQTDPTCSSSNITLCSQSVCFIVTAFDTSNDPLPGVQIEFQLQSNDFNGNVLNGQFVPSQDLTDSNGQITTVFTPDSTCPAQCASSQGGGPCQAEVIARTIGGGFVSLPVTITTTIQ